jgi:curved DNA-binding protein CbpA
VVHATRDVTAWRVLGLPPGSDSAEIKRAYRRLARTVHPDLHPGATDAERRALEARFHEITEAYRALVA